MTDQEIIIHNEKITFRRMMDAFKFIEQLTFHTEVGKKLHADMCESISQVIKPEIIKKAKEFLPKK